MIYITQKKGAEAPLSVYRVYYLFITYIVTSNPKRISVAVGFVHIVVLLSDSTINRTL